MAEDTEKCCDICRENHPVKEFVRLPCEFGHSFGSECLREWLKQLREDNRPISCPMCRQTFRYQQCGHSLEYKQLLKQERGLIRFELKYCFCLREREHFRNVRRETYILHANGDHVPGSCLPCHGDLEPHWLQDLIPQEHRAAFRILREEHHNTMRPFITTHAATRKVPDSEEGSDQWKEFWQKRSRIGEFWEAQIDPKSNFDSGYRENVDSEDELSEDEFSEDELSEEE